MITETTYVYIYNQNVEIRYLFILWFPLIFVFTFLSKESMFVSIIVIRCFVRVLFIV